MRTVIYGFLSASLIVFAWWAYKENYLTQDRQRTLETMQKLHSERFYYLQYLNADWAHLTRAERLIALVENNFNQIALGPMTEANVIKLETIPHVREQHDQISRLQWSDTSEISSGLWRR